MNFLHRLSNYFRQRDQDSERNRYELRAARELEALGHNVVRTEHEFGSDEVQNKPYQEYYSLISTKIKRNSDVLELGCGTGLHSQILFREGARVTLLDISSKSLEVCERKFGDQARYLCCDMNSIDLEDNSFDLIVANGALSYASHQKLIAEIHRLLRPGGAIIIMDSLNHNPIFILNRLNHFMRKRRSFSTIVRIPRDRTLLRLSEGFEFFQRWSYGSFIWLSPVQRRFGGSKKFLNTDWSFHSQKVYSKFGFKFLMICDNFTKSED